MEVCARMSMEPVLQDFLRGYFECSEHPFRFPRAGRKTWLPLAFQNALWYPPKQHNPFLPIENEFLIVIPEMRGKSPDVHNYMSITAQREFEECVRTFYYSQLYAFFDEMRTARYKGPSIVRMWVDRYNINEDHVDAIKRDYSRFCQYEANKHYKIKKKNSISSVQ